MRSVTFDTTAKPSDAIVLRAEERGWDVAFASVSPREASETDFADQFKVHTSLPEMLILDESHWDIARWPDECDLSRFHSILSIITGGSLSSMPRAASKGQRHQIRDAMILDAHVAAARDVFVTNDIKAFVKNGRRQRLEGLLSTRILTIAEFEAELTSPRLIVG